MNFDFLGPQVAPGISHPSELYSQLPVPSETKRTKSQEDGCGWVIVIFLILTLFLIIIIVWLFGKKSRINGLIIESLNNQSLNVDGYAT